MVVNLNKKAFSITSVWLNEGSACVNQLVPIVFKDRSSGDGQWVAKTKVGFVAAFLWFEAKVVLWDDSHLVDVVDNAVKCPREFASLDKVP